MVRGKVHTTAIRFLSCAELVLGLLVINRANQPVVGLVHCVASVVSRCVSRSLCCGACARVCQLCWPVAASNKPETRIERVLFDVSTIRV